MNNADLIVRILERAGIRHGFGIPSGNVLPLLESMRSSRVEFVLTAHEGSAGFAADAAARMTGVPGLAVATLGPGATNLATGVGSAWLDRSPMIAITCNLPVASHGRRLQMHVDHETLFRPITKASLALREGNVGEAVARALALALSEPQGPVHLDLPEDVATAPANEPLPDVPPPDRLPSADPHAIASARIRIEAARRPLAVIGASAMRMREPERIRRFLERHRIPFLTTTMAKGLVDDGHPLALGCIERACRQLQRGLVARADLLVGIGYDPIEVEYEAWVGAVAVVHIDIEPADTDGSVRLVEEVVGDLDDALQALLGRTQTAERWPPPELEAHRDAFATALRPPCPTFGPHQAVDAVRRILPASGVLAFDVGAHTHQIASQWPAPAPRRFLITNGWSSMGFGLPAAIAAKLARPELPVVCLIGDGCFQMTCGELATAKRCRLALPVVVLDDRWLGLIKVKQERRQLPHHGTELQSEPYREPPSHYFGVPARGVADAASLEAALGEALQADGPTVIEAIIDPTHYSQTVFD